MLAVNAIAHFLVDAVCAARLLGSGSGAELVTVLLLYNTLAFSSQCLLGLLCDRFGGCERLSAAACAALGLCALLPLPAMGEALCLGLGNSLFHVAAGSLTLQRSGSRALDLGLFVAPGAVGLVLGRLLPGLCAALAILLLLCAALLLLLGRRASPVKRSEERAAGSWLVAALLLLAVGARAIGSTAAFFPWQSTRSAALAAVCFVFAGKAAGGLACDRLGAGRTALLSLPAAALLIAFCSGSMPLSLLGQLLLNLSMPITLWLLYRQMPDSPGFAFGLAASALWPGQLAGGLIASAAGPAWLWILLSFGLGIFAILYATKGEISHEKAV